MNPTYKPVNPTYEPINPIYESTYEPTYEPVNRTYESPMNHLPSFLPSFSGFRAPMWPIERGWVGCHDLWM